MTRQNSPAPFDGWIPLTEYAAASGLSLGTARVRAWRSLRGAYEDRDYEFIRVAPQEPRSTVLARRRTPSPQ